MIDTKIIRQRGRPRAFEPNEGVRQAQHLFHARGYDGVSLADLTETLGIKPPSFYSAYKSKAALFGFVLDRYNREDAIPFAQILSQDRPVADALSELLQEAARRYTAHPQANGCLVLAGRHALEDGPRTQACAMQEAASALIHDYIAERHPKAAAAVRDYIATIMAGMSAQARSGASYESLAETVQLVAKTLPIMLAEG